MSNFLFNFIHFDLNFTKKYVVPVKGQFKIKQNIENFKNQKHQNFQIRTVPTKNFFPSFL